MGDTGGVTCRVAGRGRSPPQFWVWRLLLIASAIWPITVGMTYYEKLIRRASEVMNLSPRSTIVLDAESLTVLASSRSPRKAAAFARKAIETGLTPVIVEKPRHEENWIL